MAESFGSRLRHAWNAFFNKDPTRTQNLGISYYTRPDRPRFTRGTERTIIASIYNRIALDVASVTIQHVRLDENERYQETIKSGLNNCFNLEANIDQTSRAFIQDVVMSMFDEGCVAIVPIETTLDPKNTGSYDILSMRTGKIMEWYPQHVKVRVYNEQKGEREEIVLPKNMVAIIENPFYAIMNEPNSTMQRLIRKLALLDSIDEQSGSGKLDLIIQLPYAIKTEARRRQADNRRADIETQLAGSKYGIAYTDATERITQLNRPVENNLMKQVEYLTSTLYSQLNMTQGILDGTANEQTMVNYNNRTIETIVAAIVDESKRKFLTKTARTRLQTIKYFIDPFRLASLSNLATNIDTTIRNQVMSSNEWRDKLKLKPSDNPQADALSNPNISQPNNPTQTPGDPESEQMTETV